MLTRWTSSVGSPAARGGRLRPSRRIRSAPSRRSSTCPASPSCGSPTSSRSPPAREPPRPSRYGGRSASSFRDLGVRVEGRRERELVGQPVAQAAVERLVVAALVALGRHPPADVDVVGEQLLG